MDARPLVRYRGYVVSIDERGAYVRLVDDLDRHFTGFYPADELAAAGVDDRDPFFLTTVEDGDAVRFVISPAPRRRLTSLEQAAIARRIDTEFEDFREDDS